MNAFNEMHWVRRRRCIAGAFLYPVIVVLGLCDVSVAQTRLQCGQDATLPIEVGSFDQRGAEVTVVLDVPEGTQGVLVGEERGADAEWKSGNDPLWRPIDVRPPRYGLFATGIDRRSSLVVRALPGATRIANIRVRLACGDSEALQLTHCLARLTEPDVPSEGPVCTALRLHAQASAASKGGIFVDAVSLYAQAADAWRAQGDDVRASAAQLGQAESLVRLGRYTDGERAARAAAHANARAGNVYFAARARSEGCVALRELGQRQKARDCVAGVAQTFRSIGEWGDTANAYYNAASMANEDGDVAQAEAELAATRDLDLRATYPELGARLAVLAADFDLSAGRLASALAHLMDAVEVFEHTHNDRWQGNVYVRLGSLYRVFGALDEARSFTEAALSRFPSDQSGGRRAEALRVLGRIHVAAGRTDEARAAFTEALQLVQHEATPIAALQLDLDLALTGDPAALKRAEHSVLADPKAGARQRARLAVARAAHAQAEQRFGDVLARAAIPALDQLDWDDRLQWRSIQADAWAHAGRADDALAMLEAEVRLLRNRARQSRSAGLRQVVGSRLHELRAVWVDVYAALPPKQRPSVERVWALLCDTQPASVTALDASDRAVTLPRTDDADRALAAALVAPEGASAAPTVAAQRALARYYAQLGDTERSGAAPQGPPETLAGFRARLSEGTVTLAFGFGRQRSLVLSIERDRADVRLIASGDVVRDAAAHLLDTLAARQSPAMAVEAAATRVSALLIDGEVPQLPLRLVVWSDPVLEGVPFSVLTWPGQAQWLVETMPVTMLAAVSPDAARPLSVPRAVDVVTVDTDAAARSSLAPLPATRWEATWVTAALPGASVRSVETNDGLEQLLSQSGAWIHVGTHGSASPGLHGYSGLWLQSGTPDTPLRLFSWLDAADRPSAAAVVVLNACDVAAGDPRASSGATSFAAALVASGVHDVVGGMWPVSDAAAGTWVSAFYGDIGSGRPVDVGHAVWVAQQTLRRNPHFRNPFYWASLTHLTH